VIFSGQRHFWRESLFEGLKSPWAFFLTKRVPEVSKSVPLIGQKNIFLEEKINEEIQPGNSVSLLHEVVFFIDRTGRFP